MSSSILKVGDPVIYEIGSGFDERVRHVYPRWRFNHNHGYTGCYITATVQAIEKYLLYTKTSLGGGNWPWPLPGHSLYDKEQWRRLGYLKRLLPADILVAGDYVYYQIQRPNEYYLRGGILIGVWSKDNTRYEICHYSHPESSTHSVHLLLKREEIVARHCFITHAELPRADTSWNSLDRFTDLET